MLKFLLIYFQLVYITDMISYWISKWNSLKEQIPTDFSDKTDQEHTGETILEMIPYFKPIPDVPLDYMHLICLGAVKKFVISTWCFWRPLHKLCTRNIININNSLISFVKYTPIKFARKSRTLKEFKRWKATEYRNFLLYTGPISLKNILERVKYEHF